MMDESDAVPEEVVAAVSEDDVEMLGDEGESSKSESELEEDDYDLIEENLGVKVQRKKFKRVRRISDSDDETEKGQGEDRDAIAQQLFEGSDNEEDREEEGARDAARDRYSSHSEGEYSDADDFIVDDDGVPINDRSRQRKRRRLNVPDAVVQEAQDIFGVDFDYEEFENVGDAEDQEDEDDSDYEEEGEQRRTSRRKPRKGEKSFAQVFEPLELERAGYTEKDMKIRATDIPERLQTRTVPVVPAEEEELQEEAEWIFKKAKFVGVAKQFTSLPAVPPSESNWGQDWDSRTVAPGAATVVGGATASLPAGAATNSNWDEDWDKDSTVPTATTPLATPTPNATNGRLPPAPATNTGWADEDDWDTPVPPPTKKAPTPTPVSDQAPRSKANLDDEEGWEEPTRDPVPTETSAPTYSSATSGETPSTSNDANGDSEDVAVADDGGWENDEWEKGTAVSATGGGDFVDWKRPAIPVPRKPSKPVEVTPPPPPANEGGTDAWADAAWETASTTLQQPGATPRPPASSADSAPVIVPAPAVPQDDNGSKVIPKIRNTLEFIRNQNFEVPFVAFYRKEKVVPELSLTDLWKVYEMDCQFCELKTRKECLLKVYSKMKTFFTERRNYLESINQLVEEENKPITEEDLDRIRGVSSIEELKDYAAYFRTHYGDRVDTMNTYFKLEGRDEKQELDKRSIYDFKRKTGSRYSQWLQMDFAATFLQKLGISSANFAENLRDKYQRHEVEQWPVGPDDLASEIIAAKSLRSKPSELLTATRFIFAVQIANEPLVRQSVRKEFFEQATLSCAPTKKGQSEIDESHPCYTMKYLKDKPVNTFEDDQFLKLMMAEKDRLLNIKIGNTFVEPYFDEIRQLICRDEFSKAVQDWNELREQSLKEALVNHLLPELEKELRAKLVEDCVERILELAGSKLHHWLKVAPLRVYYPDENEIEWDTSQGLRVLSIVYDPVIDRNMALASVVRADGDPDVRSYRHDVEPSDRLKLPNLLRAKCEEKEEDVSALKDYIREMKPHAIAIAGESKEAVRLKQDVSEIVTELVNEDAFPEIRIEIVDNEAAKVYSTSKRSSTDLGSDYSTLQKQAISLARRVQDPLLEFAQLWNVDEDILCLRFHPLQEQVPKERLKLRLEREFVNRTCEVGVDINRALNFPHTGGVVQFICGLGPRKASALLHNLRQNHGRRLENRSQLITFACMGPKVFINCAGFIKIDYNAIGDSAESYIEILDGTRVHPESYEYARRMALDALESSENAAATAVEELLDDPHYIRKLNDLALEEYASSLNKLETFSDIRQELKARFADARPEYISPDQDELFNMVTKETPESFHVGKLVSATVGAVIRKKNKDEEQLEPIKNTETGKWQCPYCGRNEFVELHEVWHHLDAEADCPGPAVGVRVFLDNGLPGFIPTGKLSDKQVMNPEDRVYPGQKIHCRITKIQVERLSVECTSRTSDLLDSRDEWRPKKDIYYDKEHETFELQKMKEEEERKKAQKQRQVYVRRVIVHPSFRNVTYADAEKLLENMEQGEVVVRPSSKGADHLTVTWKVADGVSQHIDVREEGKASSFALGQSLWIEEEEFEDIDEIIARYVSPMASHARDIINYRYYVGDLDGDRYNADAYLLKQKEKNANKIHYMIQASKEFPGKFLLSYLPKNSAVHEFVTVTPEGFRFRQQVFDTFEELMRWFKIHYKDPPPVSTPVRTATQYAANVTQQAGYRFTGYHTSAGNFGQEARGKEGLVPRAPQTHHTTPHYSTPQGLTPYSAPHQNGGYRSQAVTPRVTPGSTGSKGTPQNVTSSYDEDECWE